MFIIFYLIYLIILCIYEILQRSIYRKPIWILRELEALVDKCTTTAITDLLKFTHIYQYFSFSEIKKKIKDSAEFFYILI